MRWASFTLLPAVPSRAAFALMNDSAIPPASFLDGAVSPRRLSAWSPAADHSALHPLFAALNFPQAMLAAPVCASAESTSGALTAASNNAAERPRRIFDTGISHSLVPHGAYFAAP